MVFPCFPYSRADKRDKNRISITAQLCAKMLESSGADSVITLDLHSSQIEGFFKIPMDALIAQPLITRVSTESSLFCVQNGRGLLSIYFSKVNKV